MNDNGNTGNQGDQEPEWMVHSIHTATSTYVTPDGSRYLYFYLECFIPGRESVKLLFNPPLAVGVGGDIMVFLKTLFGVEDLSADISQWDAGIDWNALPPAPEGIDNDGGEPPDRHEEN